MKGKQIGWLRKMRNRYAFVFINKAKGHHYGFRCVRIERALFDRKLRQVVKLVVRVYNPSRHRYHGYNGSRYVLTRECFAAANMASLGIVDDADRSKVIPIDDYAVAMLTNPAPLLPAPPGTRAVAVRGGWPRRKTVDAATHRFLQPADEANGLPPLNLPSSWVCLTPATAAALTAALAANPGLLWQNLPREPYWTVKLPDGSILEFSGYGKSRGRSKIVKAEVIEITGWQEGGKDGVSYGGSTMPSSRIEAAIKRWLAAQDTGQQPEQPTGRTSGRSKRPPARTGVKRRAKKATTATVFQPAAPAVQAAAIPTDAEMEAILGSLFTEGDADVPGTGEVG